MTEEKKCDVERAFADRTYTVPCTCRSSRCEGCPHHVDDRMNMVHHCKARLPHVEPPTDCARDEIVEWVASFYAGRDLDEAVAWLLAWANRRAANVIGHATEALETIVGMGPEVDDYDLMASRNEEQIEAIHMIARQALRFIGPKDVKTG